jgi:hypothetical protein
VWIAHYRRGKGKEKTRKKIFTVEREMIEIAGLRQNEAGIHPSATVKKIIPGPGRRRP